MFPSPELKKIFQDLGSNKELSLIVKSFTNREEEIQSMRICYLRIGELKVRKVGSIMEGNLLEQVRRLEEEILIAEKKREIQEEGVIQKLASLKIDLKSFKPLLLKMSVALMQICKTFAQSSPNLRDSIFARRPPDLIRRSEDFSKKIGEIVNERELDHEELLYNTVLSSREKLREEFEVFDHNMSTLAGLDQSLQKKMVLGPLSLRPGSNSGILSQRSKSATVGKFRVSEPLVRKNVNIRTGVWTHNGYTLNNPVILENSETDPLRMVKERKRAVKRLWSDLLQNQYGIMGVEDSKIISQIKQYYQFAYDVNKNNNKLAPLYPTEGLVRDLLRANAQTQNSLKKFIEHASKRAVIAENKRDSILQESKKKVINLALHIENNELPVRSNGFIGHSTSSKNNSKKSSKPTNIRFSSAKAVSTSIQSNQSNNSQITNEQKIPKNSQPSFKNIQKAQTKDLILEVNPGFENISTTGQEINRSRNNNETFNSDYFRSMPNSEHERKFDELMIDEVETDKLDRSDSFKLKKIERPASANILHRPLNFKGDTKRPESGNVKTGINNSAGEKKIIAESSKAPSSKEDDQFLMKMKKNDDKETSHQMLSKLLDSFGGIFKKPLPETRKARSKSPSVEKANGKNSVEDKRGKAKDEQGRKKKAVTEKILQRGNLHDKIKRGSTYNDLRANTATGKFVTTSNEIFTSFEGIFNQNANQIIINPASLTAKYTSINSNKAQNIHIINKKYLLELGKRKIGYTAE